MIERFAGGKIQSFNRTFGSMVQLKFLFQNDDRHSVLCEGGNYMLRRAGKKDVVNEYELISSAINETDVISVVLEQNSIILALSSQMSLVFYSPEEKDKLNLIGNSVCDVWSYFVNDVCVVCCSVEGAVPNIILYPDIFKSTKTG